MRSTSSHGSGLKAGPIARLPATSRCLSTPRLSPAAECRPSSAARPRWPPAPCRLAPPLAALPPSEWAGRWQRAGGASTRAEPSSKRLPPRFRGPGACSGPACRHGVASDVSSSEACRGPPIAAVDCTRAPPPPAASDAAPTAQLVAHGCCCLAIVLTMLLLLSFCRRAAPVMAKYGDESQVRAEALGRPLEPARAASEATLCALHEPDGIPLADISACSSSPLQFFDLKCAALRSGLLGPASCLPGAHGEQQHARPASAAGLPAWPALLAAAAGTAPEPVIPSLPCPAATWRTPLAAGTCTARRTRTATTACRRVFRD